MGVTDAPRPVHMLIHGNWPLRKGPMLCSPDTSRGQLTSEMIEPPACRTKLSTSTTMTARLRELATSTPARVSTLIASATTTDSMRASKEEWAMTLSLSSSSEITNFKTESRMGTIACARH